MKNASSGEQYVFPIPKSTLILNVNVQVIQLNLVRSVRTILDALSDPRHGPLSGDDSDVESALSYPREIELLKMRLLPLRHIEALLIAKLVPPNEEEATHLGHRAGGGGSISSGSDRSGSLHNQEVFVRPAGSNSNWKGVLTRGVSRFNAGRPTSAGTTGLETKDEPQEVLNSCRKDIVALWGDPTVREILRRRKIRLEEFPGLYVSLHASTCCVMTDKMLTLFS